MNRLKAWMFGLIAFAVYAVNLGAADLVTDEAKDALNVAYPHPPIVRVSMKLFAELFGHSEFGARLPSAILGAASVALVFLILKRVLKRPGVAALGAIVFMLIPPHLTWVRTAYLSPAAEFGWLLAFYGMALTHDEPERRRGDWIVAAGFLFGIWSNVQAVLIVPAAVLYLWTRRHAVFSDRSRAAAAILAASGFLGLLLYIRLVGQVRGDFERFLAEPPTYGGGLLSWLIATPLGWVALSSLAAAAIYAICVRSGRLERHPALDTAALTIPFLVAFCVLSPAAYYGPYYAATGSFLTLALIGSLPGRAAAASLIVALLPLIVLIPATHRHPQHDTFFHEHAAGINVRLEDAKKVGVLGTFGYQVNWYLESKPVRLTDETAGTQNWMVFNPSTLRDDERAFLATLAPVETWGRVTLYERQAP